jgi:hypothetical protein
VTDHSFIGHTRADDEIRVRAEVTARNTLRRATVSSGQHNPLRMLCHRRWRVPSRPR